MRKVLTELVLQQAIDKHLIDYNYNVELCLSSDTLMRVNESMLVLELFLRGTDGKDLERIIIEMNKVEAIAFVTKLKEIEKVNSYHPYQSYRRYSDRILNRALEYMFVSYLNN